MYRLTASEQEKKKPASRDSLSVYALCLSCVLETYENKKKQAAYTAKSLHGSVFLIVIDLLLQCNVVSQCFRHQLMQHSSRLTPDSRW